MRVRRYLLALLIACFPLSASAFPFGGMVTTIIPCFNQVIFTVLSGPVGGAYLWAPSTKTYLYGPPRHTGQWLLGLTTIPYVCVVNLSPVQTIPGITILMMGSSQ